MTAKICEEVWHDVKREVVGSCGIISQTAAPKPRVGKDGGLHKFTQHSLKANASNGPTATHIANSCLAKRGRIKFVVFELGSHDSRSALATNVAATQESCIMPTTTTCTIGGGMDGVSNTNNDLQSVALWGTSLRKQAWHPPDFHCINQAPRYKLQFPLLPFLQFFVLPRKPYPRF